MKSERIQLCSNTDNLVHRPKNEAHCGGEPKAWQPSGDEAVSAKYATHGQIAAPFGLAMGINDKNRAVGAFLQVRPKKKERTGLKARPYKRLPRPLGSQWA